MNYIEQSKGRKSSHLVLRAAGCLTALAVLLSALPSVWPSVAWSQQSSMRVNPSAQAQAEPRRRLRPTRAAQPLPAEQSTPDPNTIIPPLTDPASPLGSELESCDKADGVEPVSLPGAKGEIKLDRCYRGRDHLVCSFQALSSEATLLENYRNIVDANYPELGTVGDVCRIKPDSLETDLKNAVEFAGRFKNLKAEYDSRVNCANKVEQSLQDVTLPDMTQAQAMLKSMIDSIDGDIKGVSAQQAQVAEFAERINSSQKALLTIEKIHQTMCGRDQTAKMDTEDGSSVSSISGRAGPAPIETSRPSSSATPPPAARFYVVIDPVGECAVIDTQPASANTIGDGGGYSTFAAAKGAANAARAKCKRVIE